MRKFLLAATAFAAVSAYGQVDNSRTVAVINGVEIKGAEYYRRMEYLPGVGRRAGNTIAEFPPGFLTLEQLITEKLVAQLAKEKGVAPSDVEVQAEMKVRLEEQPNLLAEWKATGRTEQELINQTRFELARFKLQTQGITITDQQVEGYYNENIETYTQPKQVKLRVIVVDKADQRAVVDKDLAAGKAFAEVAKASSVDVSKASGGEFGTYPVTLLAPDLRKVIDAAKAGQVTTWVGGEQNGVGRYARFLVEEVTPAKKMTLDARLKRSIRREMILQRGTIRNDVEKQMREMRAKAKIDIKQPEFASIYESYVKAYLEQGK
ncbi:MAG TPA: peptidyl-prolyl cis-trans isomerase [Fimbriimonas sp.]